MIDNDTTTAVNEAKNKSQKEHKRGLLKGPEEGKLLTVSFHGVGKQHFDDLKKTKVLVLISIVGNELCSKEYLEATIKLATTHHGFVTLLVADEVYWHNLKPAIFTENDIPVYKKKAFEQGSVWIRENLENILGALKLSSEQYHQIRHQKDYSEVSAINELASKQQLGFEIVRWREWCQRGNTDIVEVTKLYESEVTLKKSIDKSAQSYSRRHSEDPLGPDVILRNSRDYLKEECPQIIRTAAIQNYSFIAYAGEMLEAFKATHEYFIVSSDNFEKINNSNQVIKIEDPKFIANWLTISFKRAFSEEQKKNASSIETSTMRPNSSFNSSSNTNNPFVYFQPSSSSKVDVKVSDLIYGTAKVILEQSLDNQMKIKLLVAITTKLMNLKKSNLPKKIADELIYGITKAVLEQSLDHQMKIELVATITSKLVNLEEGNLPKTNVSDLMYGITKAVLEAPLDYQIRIGFLAAITTKLMNLGQSNLQSPNSEYDSALSKNPTKP